VPAGSLLQVLSTGGAAVAAGAANVPLNALVLPCGDTTGDWGSSSCCCQSVRKLASVGVVLSTQLPGLAVVQAALAWASAARSCRTYALCWSTVATASCCCSCLTMGDFCCSPLHVHFVTAVTAVNTAFSSAASISCTSCGSSCAKGA
jgi:hypothetical protein